MPLIECTKCGKRGRVQDPVCWNCRHPRDLVYSPPVRRAPAPVSTPPEPAPKADGKDARHAMLFLGVLWFVALWLIFRGASPGQVRAQNWCIAQMEAVLARCQEARQALLVEEARLALRGIEPSRDEERSAALSSEPLENLQADLGAGGSVAHAVARFHAEHERLREDEEVGQDLERFLRQLERESR